MKKILFLILSTLGLCAAEEPSLFVVGTTSGYAPFVSLNSEGKYEGFDIDMAELIAQKMNRKLVIKDLGSMPGLMLGLKQRKVDALIWAISITQERQKAMEMVYYQGDKVVEMPFVFWNQLPADVNSLADLAKQGGVICVEAGSFQEDVLKKIDGIKLKYLDKITDAVMEIKMGKSQGTTIDPSLLPRYQAQYPQLKVLSLPLPSSQQSLGNGICVNKSNPELAAQVKKAVDELAAEGKVGELEKKWKLRE